MKENLMLDVLFYLFNNYPGMEDQIEEDRDSLHHYLEGAGFNHGEIIRAFDWLESLGDEAQRIEPVHQDVAFRMYSTYESRWLDTECQGYLMTLEQSGMLDADSREQVIDRVLELQDDYFDLAKLKWVVLMVLGNRPDADDNAMFWLDSMTNDDESPVLH